MKILITRKIPRACIDILKKHSNLELILKEGDPLTPQELIESIKGVDAIVPVMPDSITKEVIEAAGPNLKLIAHYAVGYDNIDVKTATEKNVYVSNTPGDLTESVAEFALGLMFAVAKKIVKSDEFMHQGKYHFWDPLIFLGPTFLNKTIGIVGLGRIGTHLARICTKGFNMRVLYFDEYRNDKAEQELGLIYTSLDDLLEKSDFISIHCPLLPSTRNLIGEKEFRKMKPTAYLINTARAGIVNEDALHTALSDKWIEGAGVDVVEEDSVLLDPALSNIVVTPHIASATREARIEMARMVAQNLVDVLIDNKEPTNLVNKELSKK